MKSIAAVASAVAGLVALTIVPSLGGAVEHDGCAGGVDAPENFGQAAQLVLPVNCQGETLAGNDPDDWYFINISPLNPNLNVQVCPTITKSAGWNPNLEVYYQPAGQLGPILGTFPIVYNAIGPGTLKGSSVNAVGCDNVNAALSPVEQAIGGRWLIREHLAGGDGFYQLVVT